MVICPYCVVLSQNSSAGGAHIRKHLGLMFVCGACINFHSKSPKELKNHLGKCKEAQRVKAVADLAASKDGGSKEKRKQ